MIFYFILYTCNQLHYEYDFLVQSKQLDGLPLLVTLITLTFISTIFITRQKDEHFNVGSNHK